MKNGKKKTELSWDSVYFSDERRRKTRMKEDEEEEEEEEEEWWVQCCLGNCFHASGVFSVRAKSSLSEKEEREREGRRDQFSLLVGEKILKLQTIVR